MRRPYKLTMTNSVTARAIREWQIHYPDPIAFEAGDPVTLGQRDDQWPGWVWCTHSNGKSGWVPEAYIDTKAGIARRSYTARELPLTIGDTLTLQYEEAGWYWATNQSGQSGWAPASHLEIQK